MNGIGRGGKRPGAGRKPGARSQTTIALGELARAHSKAAIDALLEVATQGESEGARVSAACALLDRAFGRPAQAEPPSPSDSTSAETTAEREARLNAIFEATMKRSRDMQVDLYKSRIAYFGERNPALAEEARRSLAKLIAENSNEDSNFSTAAPHSH
jgi:hypothetical protein